jgi:CHAD domain-containing protein
MQLTYGRGIKNLEMVLQNPVNENLHNLRKSVKYLWNQFIILRPLWPPVMGTSIRHLDLLAEKLGFDHDLAELEQFLLNNPSLNHGKGAEQLLHGIRTKRRQIQKTTIPLARRIFSERPGAVRDRLTAYEQVFR